MIQVPPYLNRDSGEQIAGAAASLQEEGVVRVVIDLSGCEMVASVGVLSLIQVSAALRAAGGRLAFCGASKTIAKTLRIMGLLQKATHHDSEREAVAAMSG